MPAQANPYTSTSLSSTMPHYSIRPLTPHDAIALYEKTGFTHIDHPLGNSRHAAVTVWMLKNI